MPNFGHLPNFGHFVKKPLQTTIYFRTVPNFSHRLFKHLFLATKDFCDQSISQFHIIVFLSGASPKNH